jgi:hypothetical protein
MTIAIPAALLISFAVFLVGMIAGAYLTYSFLTKK